MHKPDGSVYGSLLLTLSSLGVSKHSGDIWGCGWRGGEETLESMTFLLLFHSPVTLLPSFIEEETKTGDQLARGPSAVRNRAKI